MSNERKITQAVKTRYGNAAKEAMGGAQASCCSSNSCCGADEGLSVLAKDFITRDLYEAEDVDGLPLTATLASLGCGNPTALATLHPGEIVLDLGSGGGIDVLISAKRVGASGHVYGLDMTDEMLALAEKNRAEAGVTNVEFLKGNIESIPLPDNTVDVIISNCVINLSADKDSVIREAFRVLKPGGRFAVSDMVVDGMLPERIREDMLAWSGCVSGALSVDEYVGKLTDAGFEDAAVEATRIHSIQDMIDSGYTQVAELSEAEQSAVNGKLWSAFIRAKKP